MHRDQRYNQEDELRLMHATRPEAASIRWLYEKQYMSSKQMMLGEESLTLKLASKLLIIVPTHRN